MTETASIGAMSKQALAELDGVLSCIAPDAAGVMSDEIVRARTIVSAGPGELKSAETIVDLARQAGARVLVVTAQPAGTVPGKADTIIHLPAQTMADDRSGSSLLPMGTAFEISRLIFFDLVTLLLSAKTGQTMEQLRARHFNLE